MQHPELEWIANARRYLGLREIAGRNHSATILAWWQDIGATNIRDDETPWCGAFVGGILAESGKSIVSGAAAAKSWLKLPVKLDHLAYGAVVILNRPPNPANGHVVFAVGKDKHGNLMGLGGNQKNMVSIAPFDMGRIAGIRWPSIYPDKKRFLLPVLTSDGKLSTNEV